MLEHLHILLLSFQKQPIPSAQELGYQVLTVQDFGETAHGVVCPVLIAK